MRQAVDKHKLQLISVLDLGEASTTTLLGRATNSSEIQARIAQLVAYRLGTREVPGSNPGKGENFSVKISN